jgi:hypothetical protein
MLDRSHTANLFSENVQQADELAGAADAAMERSAASPEAEEAEAQLDVSRSTTAPPRARPRRPRPVDGGRRGAVRAKPRVAAPKGQLSLPGVSPRARRWARRVGPLAPVLLLVILVAHPAGCARQTTRSGSLAPSTPAGATPTRTHPLTGSDNGTRPAQAPRPRQPRPSTTPATSTVVGGPVAHAPRGASALAAAASAQAPAAPPAVTRTVVSISVPAAPNTGSPPREGRGKGNEFGFER